MTAPSQVEFTEAVQSPAAAFGDPDLQRGQVALNQLDLPKAYSGGYAIVYQLTTPTGSWAVRCFARPSPDLERRYALISQAVTSVGSPHLVEVIFQSRGIRVNGAWWPITKMRWVEGVTLNEALDRDRDPTRVAQLRAAFADMVGWLESVGIAHGDLQHGNILVRPDGSLVLVDYDDMFVPSMTGMSEQLGAGHRNYQHPGRREAKFDERLDRFPAIVIWAALRVLESHPEWWDEFNSGENLLFTAQDFAQPQASKLMRRIRGDSELRWIAERIAAAARTDIERVPSFRAFVGQEFPKLPRATSEPNAYLAPPVLLDLRRDDPMAFTGSFVRVIGEVVGYRRGRTRYGDPYLFINVGARGCESLRLVVWSEALDRIQPDVLKAIRRKEPLLVLASGLVASYRGEPEIEIKQSPQLVSVDVETARQRLGSPWEDEPPIWQRLSDPRVGDRVHHDKFGFGLVHRVMGDVVEVEFAGSVREISYEQYFLGLVDRLADGTQPSAAVRTEGSRAGRSTRSRRGAAESARSQGRSKEARRRRSPGPVAGSAHGWWTAEAIDRLNSLYGGQHASPASAKTGGPESKEAVAEPRNQAQAHPAPPSTSTAAPATIARRHPSLPLAGGVVILAIVAAAGMRYGDALLSEDPTGLAVLGLGLIVAVAVGVGAYRRRSRGQGRST